MGFFSWKTQDTNKSIANSFSVRPTFRVIMTDDKGNEYIEDNYEGYGEFGGKDFYALVDEMNGGRGDRLRGINLALGENKSVLQPSLSESGGYFSRPPKECGTQGYFYDEDWLE